MEWVPSSEVKKRMKVLRDAVKELNEGDYSIKVSARLVGSSKRNLVLSYDNKGSFDCDVDIIITSILDGIKIEQTREIFNNYIGPILRNAGYISFSNRTRTFNYKKKSKNAFTHSFDLMVQIEDEITYSVNLDKGDSYSLGPIKASKNYLSKERVIKNEGLEKNLRDLYKNKKENNPQKKASYILYCECLNELTQHSR